MKNLLLSLALVMCAFALPAFAEQPPVPTEPILMDETNMPVTFNHDTHTSVTCESCHHPVEGVATYEPCATAGCHDAMGMSERDVNSYYQAMHKARDAQFGTCVSCHTETAGSDADLRRELTACRGSACHA